MKAKAISVNEWLYPDIFDYQSASDSIRLHTPRNSYAAVQIQLSGVEAGPVSVAVTGKLAELPQPLHGLPAALCPVL
jgi:hypothetical protein